MTKVIYNHSKMDKSINQRFAKILEEKNISQVDFAELISSGRANVNNWIKLKNAIPLDTIVSLLNMFPDIDARWLLTGSPRAYNVDQPIRVMEEPETGDKGYIIKVQKQLIDHLKTDIERLNKTVYGEHSKEEKAD